MTGKDVVRDFVEEMRKVGWDEKLSDEVIADSSDGLAFFIETFPWDSEGLSWWCTDMPDGILAYRAMFEAAAAAGIKLDRIFAFKDDWDGVYARFHDGVSVEELFPPVV